MAAEAYVLEAFARGFANQTSEIELRSSASIAYVNWQVTEPSIKFGYMRGRS